MSPEKTLLCGARIFNGRDADCRRGDVLIIGQRIADVAPRITVGDAARIIDATGYFLMPGLIDAHVHVCGSDLDIAKATNARWSYLAAFGFANMRQRLNAGYTTLRDMGGADIGMAQALKEGLADGPRLFYSGKLVSQTGGHGDSRSPHLEMASTLGDCCSPVNKFAWVVDGVDAVRHAVREELRLGATQIKIMASGGILSPADPLQSLQFSDGEILAAVEEATNHGTYVSAHCHPAKAIRRCANLGVRVIEHATMMDEAAAEAMVAHGTYAVPTLAILEGLKLRGEALGFPKANMDKLQIVRQHAFESVSMLRRCGIPMGFGTDLFGKTHGLEHTEFRLRKDLQTPLEILRSATSVNAEILCRSHELGCIEKDALADIIVLEGDPLADILVLEDQRNVMLVMKDGVIHRNQLSLSSVAGLP